MAQRRPAVGDLLRTFDMALMALLSCCSRLNFHWQATRRTRVAFARAHLPGRLQDLPVGEVVAVPLEVPGQVVRGSGDPEPTMNPNPASSSAFRFAVGSIPASATTIMSRTPWRCANALSTGIRVVVSALLPSNRCTSRGNPAGSRQEPNLDLRAAPVLLAHPRLAQLVLVAALEVQRRHVVEHQAAGTAAHTLPPAATRTPQMSRSSGSPAAFGCFPLGVRRVTACPLGFGKLRKGRMGCTDDGLFRRSWRHVARGLTGRIG